MSKNSLQVNVYTIVEECVENGIEAGWNKAHKHTPTPSEDVIKQEIENYIMLEISEHFKFDE